MAWKMASWVKSGLIMLSLWWLIFFFLFIVSWNQPKYQLKYGLTLLLIWLVISTFFLIRNWNWPYWLKAGLILLSIWLVIFIFFLYNYLTCRGMLCGAGIIIPIFPSVLLIDLLTDSFLPFGFFAKHALSMILISAFLNGLLIFIMGALIGFVYGKVKYKK